MIDLHGKELYSYHFRKSSWKEPVPPKRNITIIIIEIILATAGISVVMLWLGAWLNYVESPDNSNQKRKKSQADSIDDDGVISLGDIDAMTTSLPCSTSATSPMHISTGVDEGGNDFRMGDRRMSGNHNKKNRGKQNKRVHNYQRAALDVPNHYLDS